VTGIAEATELNTDQVPDSLISFALAKQHLVRPQG